MLPASTENRHMGARDMEALSRELVLPEIRIRSVNLQVNSHFSGW